MFHQLKNKNFYIILAADAVIMSLSLLFAYLLRFEFALNDNMAQQVVITLAWMIPLKIAVFFWFRVYRGMWRYIGLSDIWLLLKAASTASLLTVALLIFVFRFEGYPRSVFIIDFFLVVRIYAPHIIELEKKRYTAPYKKGFMNSTAALSITEYIAEKKAAKSANMVPFLNMC